jgi:hypothetical protein
VSSSILLYLAVVIAPFSIPAVNTRPLNRRDGAQCAVLMDAGNTSALTFENFQHVSDNLFANLSSENGFPQDMPTGRLITWCENGIELQVVNSDKDRNFTIDEWNCCVNTMKIDLTYDENMGMVCLIDASSEEKYMMSASGC